MNESDPKSRSRVWLVVIGIHWGISMLCVVPFMRAVWHILWSSGATDWSSIGMAIGHGEMGVMFGGLVGCVLLVTWLIHVAVYCGTEKQWPNAEIWLGVGGAFAVLGIFGSVMLG